MIKKKNCIKSLVTLTVRGGDVKALEERSAMNASFFLRAPLAGRGLAQSAKKNYYCPFFVDFHQKWVKLEISWWETARPLGIGQVPPSGPYSFFWCDPSGGAGDLFEERGEVGHQEGEGEGHLQGKGQAQPQQPANQQ